MASQQLDQQQMRKIYMLCYRDMFIAQINNGKMKDNEVELHAQVRKPKSLPSKPNWNGNKTFLQIELNPVKPNKIEATSVSVSKLPMAQCWL